MHLLVLIFDKVRSSSRKIRNSVRWTGEHRNGQQARTQNSKAKSEQNLRQKDGERRCVGRGGNIGNPVGVKSRGASGNNENITIGTNIPDQTSIRIFSYPARIVGTAHSTVFFLSKFPSTSWKIARKQIGRNGGAERRANKNNQIFRKENSARRYFAILLPNLFSPKSRNYISKKNKGKVFKYFAYFYKDENL